MDYRIQRLKEDLTNAQQRNKKQRIQLANYKKVHERDLETIKKYKEVIDKAINRLQLLIDIGFDYDGFNQIESLKTLIDELVGYSIESITILKGIDKEVE